MAVARIPKTRMPGNSWRSPKGMIEVGGAAKRGRTVKQEKVKWGVLGAASIATKKVIPGMQKGEWSEIAAIASRDLNKARDAAKKLGIPKAYGSYEEMLADTEIEAVYNPLPNHLHVPWSRKAAEAGKHVLCEKPLSLTVAEARTLLEVRERCGVKIGERSWERSVISTGILPTCGTKRSGAEAD